MDIGRREAAMTMMNRVLLLDGLPVFATLFCTFFFSSAGLHLMDIWKKREAAIDAQAYRLEHAIS